MALSHGCSILGPLLCSAGLPTAHPELELIFVPSYLLAVEFRQVTFLLGLSPLPLPLREGDASPAVGTLEQDDVFRFHPKSLQTDCVLLHSRVYELLLTN